MSATVTEGAQLLDRIDLPGLVWLLEQADERPEARAGLRSLLDGAQVDGVISALIRRSLNDMDEGRAEFASDAFLGYLSQLRDCLRGYGP